MGTNPAGSLRKYIGLFDKQNKKVALDYGSGNLRNAVFLHRKGYEVYAVDLPHKIKIRSLPKLSCILPCELRDLNIRADIVICTFVLNLISGEERKEVLDLIAEKIVPGGYLLIETKGFSLLQLDQMIIPRGFVRVHNHRGRYTVIVLYRYVGC
ncbi:MAG: hypothetical protein CVU89_03960 [Firmicutes bacterium HGW-Firmicutes-14]|jgi:2-polyprenyl-3-methyl-5-hydroxy-6-metoxy-1,4-benzoquinol methylase|nr:MAG: hypothetical protein CVU89_03960 [Firmicutes bacterium HGW-Firmicutes-14]